MKTPVKVNPIKGLLVSRKFWVMIIDVLLSTFTVVGGWYLSPNDMSKAVAIIGIYQPVFLFVIGSITVEDNAERKLQAAKLSAGVHPDQLAVAENEWAVEAVKQAKAKTK